jgi:hypothetical protein
VDLGGRGEERAEGVGYVCYRIGGRVVVADVVVWRGEWAKEVQRVRVERQYEEGGQACEGCDCDCSCDRGSHLRERADVREVGGSSNSLLSFIL